MGKKIKILIVFLFTWQSYVIGQTLLNIYPDSLLAPINTNLKPGVFYVPKTASAGNDFISNGILQNGIRTNVIESVLNNTSNLTSCLTLLSSVKTELQNLSLKCDKLIFIFEKMPGWLSSSTNSMPTSTPGWSILNTKPPSNWNTWQTVVDSITSKIVNQFGISNAYFEIWNEPDLGSWTGTMNEYFRLYKTTFDGVKSASNTAKVGGPAVNFWANNIFWQPLYGHLSNLKADSSLIGQLLDSVIVWNKVPDFISWHNFNLSYQEFSNAEKYIHQKLVSLSIPNIPLIVSEWNAPSQIRDTRLASAFMIKAQLTFSKTTIANNLIAAWQDFNPGITEFHNDYGLLTYGAIHKPAYNAILLSEKLNGITCNMNANVLYDGISSISNDTLHVLISNYSPPAFLEAFNQTLFQGQFNIKQLDSAGYINIIGNSAFYLDSIYKGLVIIPNGNTMQIAINNSISVFQHYDTIAKLPRSFTINLNGYNGNYAGQLFILDSTNNNLQFKYDSLLAAGFTRSLAISSIQTNQQLVYSNITTTLGNYSLTLQPNALCLLKIKIPVLTSVVSKSLQTNNFLIYPNPVYNKLTLIFYEKKFEKDIVKIYNSMGMLVKTLNLNMPITTVDIANLQNGLYYISSKKYPAEIKKMIKQ